MPGRARRHARRSPCNVEVYAERNPADLHVVKVTEANLTYVAIDRRGPAAADPED